MLLPCIIVPVYGKSGKDELRLEYLNKAIQLDANFYRSYYNRSILSLRVGEATKAEQALTKAKTLG